MDGEDNRLSTTALAKKLNIPVQQLFATLESLSVSYSDSDDKIEQCTESLRRLKLLPSLLKLNSAYFRESLF